MMTAYDLLTTPERRELRELGRYMDQAESLWDIEWRLGYCPEILHSPFGSFVRDGDSWLLVERRRMEV